MQFKEIRSQLAFEERPYDELPAALVLSTLSNAAWYVEDLFGEVPETFMHADGGETLDGNVCLHRPEDHGYYVVDGDLTVDGVLCLTVWDVTNIFVVAGDLTAKGIVLDSDVQLYVLGATTLSGPLISSLSDAGFAMFRGPVTARGRFDLSYGETVFKDDAPEREEQLDDEFAAYEDLLEELDNASPGLI